MCDLALDYICTYKMITEEDDDENLDQDDEDEESDHNF